MPSRTAATIVVEAEEPVTLPGLQFNEPLSWRAGKPIAVAELLRRLQSLSKEMQEMEQEENERESFLTVAKELVNPNLLAHKDKGVKALTACCLVDILRLCAPDAPYTGQQLRDIFNMIITQILPALSDPSNAYNAQHLYVLGSLAQVKSIVLLSDIPSSEALTRHLFQICFDVLSGSSKTASGEELQKNVEMNMTQLLVCVVDESQILPPEAVDIIVAQFLRADPRALSGGGAKAKKNGVVDQKQSILVLKQLPPAYNMAKYICNACPDKMARYFSQYFNEVVIDASTSSTQKITGKNRRKHSNDPNESEDEQATGPTDEDLKELRKVHGLLRELWRACPAVLQNVVPQLEAELSADNVQLRLLATETLGDIISGIGAAGLPPPPTMDPSAYPPRTLSTQEENQISINLLTKPSSPHPFPHAHPQAYANYLGRRHDKSSLIRSAWTTGIGRILFTSAGGAGLSISEEEKLLKSVGNMMGDADEKVRIAAVKVIGNFTFQDVISKVGRSGGVAEAGAVLNILAERMRDRKHTVREEAMTLLSRLWGVAAGDLAAGDEQVTSILGGVPSKVLDTYYTNDPEIMLLLDRVFSQQLLPLTFPPVKSKTAKLANGSSQKSKDSQTIAEKASESVDPDKIRIERILLLAKGLDERAKKVFYAMQARQLQHTKVMSAYLTRCEDYNGGVMDDNEAQIKDHLKRLIQSLANQLPNPSQATSDLWKFVKTHDRRSYQLIRFCMSPESDYQTVVKAIKELTKRITDSTSPNSLLESLIPIVYRVSLIIYNRSHVPAIMEYSKTDHMSLAATAHEVLRDISSRTPEILKAHIQEICKTLQDEAPSAKKANDPGAVDNLKACASFASRYPKEVPSDRKFVQAMAGFALYGSPPEAAKYAVSVIWAASDRKEMLIKDLTRKCVQNFRYGEDGFLSRLATLSQIMLLAPDEIDETNGDAIIDIAIKQILLQVREHSTKAADAYEWSSRVETEALAKCWALKILVNQVRSHASENLAKDAAPVYNLLLTLVENYGELSESKRTPPTHKSRLRLLAARLYLKLSTKNSHDALLTPTAFNTLATVAQDGQQAVRAGFLQRLKKYLAQQRLSQRFYTIPFLLAFEPSEEIRADTVTWIKSRSSAFSNRKLLQHNSTSKSSMVMESTFARLISVLAHHPDYSDEAEDLIDFARYIIFYLQNAATEDNLSLIYHVAQRIKQCRDATAFGSGSDHAPEETDNRLYHLSDLAQLTIRKFEDIHNWTIQTLPVKVRLPSSLFTELKSHTEAQRIAEHNYLPKAVEEGVEDLVKSSLRASRPGSGRKRKSEGGDYEGREHKKAKALPLRKASEAAAAKERKWQKKSAVSTKTPKTKKAKDAEGEGSGERRRSGRVKDVEKIYRERDSDEDDAEMMMMNIATKRSENEEAEEYEMVEEGQEEEEEEKEVEEEIDEGEGDDSQRRTNGIHDEGQAEARSTPDEVEKEEAEAAEEEEDAAPTPAPKSLSKPHKTRAAVSPKTKTKPKTKPKETRSRATTRGRAKAHDTEEEMSDPAESD